MRIRSKGLQTDLFFWRQNGTVIDRGEYLFVETPSNPSYYWGNALVFERPPVEGDDERWRRLFRREFAERPGIRHELLGWQMETDEAGAVEQFLRAGFVMETNVTLTAEQVHPPPKPNDEIEVRSIETEAEWDEVAESQVASRPERFTAEQYRTHVLRRLSDYRRLINEGHGRWYGAFLGERLCADLGLFHDGATGRFQWVETLPEFRRRGICGTLVYAVARQAFEQGIETLVMVADEAYHAARIYESVGFAPHDKYSFCCLYPEQT
ncbi:MAG TPA: GNAT family N-acetyltransferase [Pyrinomonadaceae bacterium]|nr:GNAT family N-acetyltransferase [Pyrinomonadaceae bacterium]